MHRIVCCWKYSPPSQQRASVLSNHGRWLFNAASLQDSAGNFSSNSSRTIAISSGASVPIRQAGEHRIQYPTQRAPAWCVTPSPRTISAQESSFRSLSRSCPFTMAREEQPNGALNPTFRRSSIRPVQLSFYCLISVCYRSLMATPAATRYPSPRHPINTN